MAKTQKFFSCMSGGLAEKLVNSGKLDSNIARSGFFMTDSIRKAIAAKQDAPSRHSDGRKLAVVSIELPANVIDAYVHEFEPYDNLAASENAVFYEISSNVFPAINAEAEKGNVHYKIIKLL